MSSETSRGASRQDPVGVRRWVSRGGWAILDQGLFATANFVLNILLARLLLPSEYGSFSVAYAILLLGGTFHTAFLTEPMLVFGPGRYKSRFREYLRALVRWHWILTGAFALAFMATGIGFLWFGSSQGMAWTFVAMGIATAPILLQWLFRRSCYVNLQPRFAVEAGAVYFATIVAGLFALNSRGVLAAGTAFILLAVGSLNASGWIFWRLTRLSHETDQPSLDVRQAALAHLDYGRWAAGTALLSWVPGNVYYILLPIVTSMEDVAGLRALMNLIMPVLHVIAALGLLLLPALVKKIQDGARLGPVVRNVSMLFILAAAGYGLFLMVAGEWLLEILYDNKYDSFSRLLLPLSILPIASAMIAVFGSVIRAFERPDLVFRAYLGTLAVTVTLGLALIYTLGVGGAAIGLLLSSSTTALLMGALMKTSSTGESRLRAHSQGHEDAHSG